MLSEKKVLKSVEVLPAQNVINVCWEVQILRDNAVISSVPHRCAYEVAQKADFLADVENGTVYASVLGW